SGSKFPPITLALYKNKKYLVDGKHRYEAHKLLKKDKITAEIFTGWSKKKIFEEAIKRNVAHGQVLSPYEKRLIILRLRKMKYKNIDICNLVNVPQDKLQNFVGQRLVSSTTGKTIIDTVIKSAFKHRAGGQYSQKEIEEMEEAQGQFSTRSQIFLVKQLVEMFNNNLIDFNDEQIYEKLLILKQHLKDIK
ncbi:MAG: hypothetical protein KAJ49_04590, partial [Arcobacteraceae bacterium]|nr:hypothetical protein [Arcobacteraceae bacterium]